MSDVRNEAAPIRRVGVIGAGVMGSGIAAHFANAGVRVVLLDIVPPGLSDDEKKDPARRDAFAAQGLAKALKNKPALFFAKENAALVETGNLEDHLDELRGADLVIEAIVENLEVKRRLFARLEEALDERTIVASNTSGLPIARMLEGRGEGFRKRFLVMHFFNPVRYMKLLELVAGPETDPAVFARVRRAGVEQLGKGIVVGKDTPNFVGNRIGTHAMLATIHQMLADGLAPEDVDAITGRPMGHPKSASFRTADLVGIDTFHHVASNCHAALEGDEEREVFKPPPFLDRMVERKLLGDKTKGGFYRKAGDQILTLDLETLEYRPKGGDADLQKAMKAVGREEDPRARLRKLVAGGEGAAQKAADFAWKVLSKNLAYAARRVPEIADSVVAVDDAMRWGYSWELGPFEAWDALGFAETARRMKADGLALPATVETMLAKGAEGFYRDGQVWDLVTGGYVDRPRDPRETPLAEVRRGGKPVLANASAEAWDLGDGVLGLTFKTKANSIDDGIIDLLPKAVEAAERGFRGMLITNEGEHFCVGANLFGIVMAAGQGQWEGIERLVGDLQAAMQRMTYASVPVVAAPFGMALGGGLEICLAATSVQAAAETYAGLVEPGVGLVPGGAGHLNLLKRALEGIPDGANVDTFPFVARVFENIATARVATSGVEAQRFGFFRLSDGVSFDRARHLAEAKARVIGLAEAGHVPRPPMRLRLAGEHGIATLRSVVDTMVWGGYATEHDKFIASQVAEVLCGGLGGASREVHEEEILALERAAFVRCCKHPKSQERMQHMLQTNKPLRN